jgi:transcriptional regulator with XRE-family HTH domain
MGILKNLPLDVADRLRQLGYRIRLARTRRRLSGAEVAAKAGINRNTLTALEHGKSGVAIGAYATVLWVLGLERTLDAVAHADSDIQGKTLEAARRPVRVRKPQAVRDEYDF